MKRVFFFVSLLLCFMVTSLASSESATDQLQEMYAQAELLMVTGEYANAAESFDTLKLYSDAWQKAIYCRALDAAEVKGMYDVAIQALTSLADYKDSMLLASYYQGRNLQTKAEDLIASGISSSLDDQLDTAKGLFHTACESFEGLSLFKDSNTRMLDCKEKESNIANEQEIRKEPKYQEAVGYENEGKFQAAVSIYSSIIDYKDSKERIAICNNEINYRMAMALEMNEDYTRAIDIYKSLGQYKDCLDRIAVCKEKLAPDVFIESVTGFQPFEVSIEIAQNGQIKSVSVSDHNETPGLGADLIADEAVFGSLQGQDIRTAHIDAKAGVTLTTNALNDALSKAAAEFEKRN